MIKIESTTETIESKGVALTNAIDPCRKNCAEGGAGADKERVCEKCRSRYRQLVRPNVWKERAILKAWGKNAGVYFSRKR